VILDLTGSKSGNVEPGAAPVPGELTVADVHDALASLYNNPALAESSLAARYPELRAVEGVVERAQWLRSLLLDAIEAMRPLRHGADYAQAVRDWQVLSLRYASGLTAEQIADELSVGRRQIYRDLRRAELKLCDVLRSPALASRMARPAGEHDDARQREVASIRHQPGTLDARDLLATALHAVEGLARARQVNVRPRLPPTPLLVSGTPGVVRAALTQLMSSVVQAAIPPDVDVLLRFADGAAAIRIRFAADEEPGAAGLADSISLARLVGLECRLQRAPSGEWELSAMLPGPTPRRLLIVEDNPGASELYERYLAGTGWQVLTLEQASKAASVARAHKPSAIILDIMMPEVDGWTVLQDLRVDPETADIPVIICSVLHDPGLAATLGATACLAKPVSRWQLIAALERALRPRP